MITIEKIINGYIVMFKNTDNIDVKVFFPTFEELTTWMKTQLEPEKKDHA